MELKNLSNFDIDRTVKSVSMKKLIIIWLLGFVFFITFLAYLPSLNKGAFRLVGLLLIFASAYASVENTSIILSAETCMINGELYLISEITSIKTEVGKGNLMKSLVINLINDNTIRIICLTFKEDDERTFSVLAEKLKVAKIYSDRKARGLE